MFCHHLGSTSLKHVRIFYFWLNVCFCLLLSLSKSHHILEILGEWSFSNQPFYDSMWHSHVHVLRGRNPKMSLSESLKLLIWLPTYKARTALILESNFDTLITELKNPSWQRPFEGNLLRVSTNISHINWGAAWPYNFFAVKFHERLIQYNIQLWALPLFLHLHKSGYVNVIETSVFFASIFIQGSLYWRVVISRIIPGSRYMYKLVLERF